MSRVGKCHICDRDAAVNTPGLVIVDRELQPNTLVCYRCQRHFHGFLRGIDQFMDSNGNYILVDQYFFADIVVAKFSTSWHAWRNHGSTSWPLTDDDIDEANRNPWRLVIKLWMLEKQGYFTCTRCRRTFEKDDNYNICLFADMMCDTCYNHHLEFVEHQRKTGDICLLCGKPRSICHC